MINTTEFITTPIGYNFNGYSNSVIAGVIVYLCNKHRDDLKILVDNFNLNASPSELIANFVIATNKDCDKDLSIKQANLKKELFELLNKISDSFNDETKPNGLALRYNNGNGNNLNDIIITKNAVSHLININTVEGGTPVYAPAEDIYKEKVIDKKANYVLDKFAFEDDESERVAKILEFCREYSTENSIKV